MKITKKTKEYKEYNGHMVVHIPFNVNIFSQESEDDNEPMALRIINDNVCRALNDRFSNYDIKDVEIQETV